MSKQHIDDWVDVPVKNTITDWEDIPVDEKKNSDSENLQEPVGQNLSNGTTDISQSTSPSESVSENKYSVVTSDVPSSLATPTGQQQGSDRLFFNVEKSGNELSNKQLSLDVHNQTVKEKTQKFNNTASQLEALKGVVEGGGEYAFGQAPPAPQISREAAAKKYQELLPQAQQELKEAQDASSMQTEAQKDYISAYTVHEVQKKKLDDWENKPEVKAAMWLTDALIANPIAGVGEGLAQTKEGVGEATDLIDKGELPSLKSTLNIFNGMAGTAFSTFMGLSPVMNITFQALPAEVQKLLFQPIDAISGMTPEDKAKLSQNKQLLIQSGNILSSFLVMGVFNGVMGVFKNPTEYIPEELDKIKEGALKSSPETLAKAQEVLNSIPDDLPIEVQQEVAPLIAERTVAEEKKAKVAKPFQEVEQQKIDAIDEEIKAKSAIKSMSDELKGGDESKNIQAEVPKEEIKSHEKQLRDYVKSLPEEMLKKRENFIYEALANPDVKNKDVLRQEAMAIADERLDRSLPPIEKPSEKQSEEKTSEKFVEKPISEISTDETRFQNRTKLDQEHVKSIAENWNDNELDPVVIWKDKNGKSFILAGHHRLEAAKQLGKKAIDARYFKGTEAEAIKYAKEKSNANRRMEQPHERAAIYRKMREEGATPKEIKAALEVEGKNKNYVENLAHLNPKGKMMSLIKSFQKSGDKQTARITEQAADWIGEARKFYTEFTDAHETELYDWLINKDNISKIKNKTDFIERISRIADAVRMNPEEPLNLEHRQTYGRLENEKRQEINSTTSQIKELEKERKGVVSENRAKQITDEIGVLNKKLVQLNKELITAKEGDKAQTNLFDNIQESITNNEITDEQASQFLQSEGSAERTGAIENIERKAESEKETDLNEAITEADKLVGEKPPETLGISHDALNKLAKSLGLPEVIRGRVRTPKEYADMGRAMLKAGVDPNTILTSGLEAHEQASVARAYLEELKKQADGIKDKSSQEYKDISKKIEDYETNIVKPIGTKFAELGLSLQGERDLVTDSFYEAEKNLKQSLGVSELTKEQTEKLQKLTEENRNLKDKVAELEQKETDAIDKDLGDKNYVDNADKIVNETRRERRIKNVDKFFDDAIKSISQKGVAYATIIPPDVIKVALKGMKEAYHAGEEISKIIEDAVKYISSRIKKDWDKEKFTKEYTDALSKLTKESDEQKAIARKEKQIEDFKAGVEKKRTAKEYKFTDEEKAKYDTLNQELKNLKLSKLTEVLQEQFVNKKGNVFSRQEAGGLWNYMKEKYMNNGVEYEDAIKYTSADMGLTADQVRHAILTPKAKPISIEKWKQRSSLSKSRNATQQYINDQTTGFALRQFKKLSGDIRDVATFGHGHVFLGTHAGLTAFSNPVLWTEAYIKGIKLAYGMSDAQVEQFTHDFENRPLWAAFNKAGLQNDLHKAGTDMEISQQSHLMDVAKKIHGKGGAVGKVGEILVGGSEAGRKGFMALKWLRQELAEQAYNNLTAEEKSNSKVLESISKLINNATGATNVKMTGGLNEVMKEVSFAGGMEVARWEKIFRNPPKAILTLSKMPFEKIGWIKDLPPEEKVFATLWAKRVATQMLVYGGLVGISKLIFNPDDKTLHGKLSISVGKNTELDPTSGMLSLINFLGKLWKDKSDPYNAGRDIFKYGRGKLAPTYQTAADVVTGHDVTGNAVPFRDVKPENKYAHKLTYGEYAEEKLPIPLAEAFKEYNETQDEASGIISFIIAGGTGTRKYTSEEKDQKQSGEPQAKHKFTMPKRKTTKRKK